MHMETNHNCMVRKATASKRPRAPSDTPTRIYSSHKNQDSFLFTQVSTTSFYCFPPLFLGHSPHHLNMPVSPTFPPHPALIVVSVIFYFFFAMTRGSTSCPVPNLNSHMHSLLRSDRSSSYHIPSQWPNGFSPTAGRMNFSYLPSCLLVFFVRFNLGRLTGL